MIERCRRDRWMEDLLGSSCVARSTEEAGQAVMARAFADCGLSRSTCRWTRTRCAPTRTTRRSAGTSPGKRNVVATWERPRRRALADPQRPRRRRPAGHRGAVDAPAVRAAPRRRLALRARRGRHEGRAGGDDRRGARAARAPASSSRGDLQLQSVVEEECTGNGTLQCLLAGHTADACVMTEPHPDHLTVAQVGVLWFHVDVARRARARGARRRAASTRSTPRYAVLAELRALERELNADPPAPYDAFEHPINLNPGVVAGRRLAVDGGGRVHVVVPARVYPGEDPRELQRAVEAAVARRLRAPRCATTASSARARWSTRTSRSSRSLSATRTRAVHGEAPGAGGDDGDDGRAALRPPRHPGGLLRPAGRADPRDRRARVAARRWARCARVLAHFVLDWCGESNGASRTPRGEQHGHRPRAGRRRRPDAAGGHCTGARSACPTSCSSSSPRPRR